MCQNLPTGQPNSSNVQKRYPHHRVSKGALPVLFSLSAWCPHERHLSFKVFGDGWLQEMVGISGSFCLIRNLLAIFF